MTKLQEYAAAHRLPEDVAKLQMQLDSLPLIPLNSILRKRRDKLTSKLLAMARERGCVAEVNLLSGTAN